MQELGNTAINARSCQTPFLFFPVQNQQIKLQNTAFTSEALRKFYKFKTFFVLQELPCVKKTSLPVIIRRL